MAVKELENKIKSAVSSLSKPGGVVDMTWLEEKDESSEDDPTPSPDPTPEPVVQYTLTFSGGAGSDGSETNPSSLTVNSGTVVDLTQYNPDPTNHTTDHTEGEPFTSYTFTGWYDTVIPASEENGWTDEYNFITSITMDSDKAVYSFWDVYDDPGTPAEPPAEEPIV